MFKHVCISTLIFNCIQRNPFEFDFAFGVEFGTAARRALRDKFNVLYVFCFNG